ncbi:MAG TPA: hypothetical protein VJJ80_00135 [Patescibacteria group bacterium]|nr:hypothetical protein [Patescibacteria group bacterium]
MIKNNLFEKSEKFKADADKILKESDLINFLSKYGKVKPVGAYHFDIMMRGDIDFHIFMEKVDKEKVIDALNKLIGQGYFQAYMFDDFVKYSRLIKNSNDQFPYGYYLGLIVIPKGYDKRWKIDIWFIEKDSLSGKKYYQLLKNNLNEENKKLILELKDYKIKNKLDFPSTIIYDAVLVKGIKNINGFIEYIKDL